MTSSGQGDLSKLLRELKERRGYSFGTLARKLGVSRSTLHRYCTGEAVPPHFSVVELFARECGASPADVAELRRRWQLSDSPTSAPAPVDAAPAEPHGDSPLPPTSNRFGSSLAAGLGLTTVVTALIVTGGAFAIRGLGSSTGPTAAAAADSGPLCRARPDERHTDTRGAGHIWKGDHQCPNRALAPLYDHPGGGVRVATMDTTLSWFVCWVRSPRATDTNDAAVWYYTRGDRVEPGTAKYDRWGFVASSDVPVHRHPVPSMPQCTPTALSY